MSLTVPQELLILTSATIDDNGTPLTIGTTDFPLSEYVYQSMVGYAIDFQIGHKAFDDVDAQGDPINEKAKRYLIKERK